MKFPKYLLVRNKECGAGLIILNDVGRLPFIGQIIQYKDNITMLTALNNKTPIAYKVIPGYTILIQYAGIVGRGFKLVGGMEGIAEIKDVVNQMADYYYENIILEYEPRYTKFKL